MFDPWSQKRRWVAGRALVALIGAAGCMAAVTYAATAPGGDRSPATSAAGVLAQSRPGIRRPPRPRIVRRPAKTTLSNRVVFRYVDRRGGAEFQCKLDAAAWKRCGSRVAYRGLAVGAHRFLVRSTPKGGPRSLPSRHDWLQAEPKRFSIEAELSGLDQLYPGAPPVALPLVLTNPNSARIFVTGVRVSVSADPTACPSAENLELIQAGASKATPIEIPAGGSVRLPAPGVAPPAIALRDLPVNQDACQGARFPLDFSGEAYG
jgi:hypothetical protein